MKIRKWLKQLIIYVLIAGTAMFICLTLILTGKVTLDYSGFAFDSQGNFYLGKDSKIEVYHDEALVRTINAKTSRGYAFTVQNDTIILSTGTTVYTMDLQGNVTDEKEDPDTRTFNALQKQKKVFTSDDGHTYTQKKLFGRISIVSDDGDTVFRMPVSDFVIKSVLTATVISLFIAVPVLIVRAGKEPADTSAV